MIVDRAAATSNRGSHLADSPSTRSTNPDLCTDALENYCTYLN
jgi:hypothetical protein